MPSTSTVSSGSASRPTSIVALASGVLGLVSSKVSSLESPDALKRRIAEATRFIALDRLATSPQCGFASTVAGNPITKTDERAKLALVLSTARTVWH